MSDYDVILIGGGIVGIATAWKLQQRFTDAKILVLEKEAALAAHQTGHNSGVIHAGVYYTPGSLKADFCKRGAAMTVAFCREHGLPYLQCGKLLVATDDVEMERMAALEQRCRRNGIELERLDQPGLKQREPHITGMGALWVPATGITDYRAVAAAMADHFKRLGGHIRIGRRVLSLKEDAGTVSVRTDREAYKGSFLIACAGLMADRLVRMMQLDLDVDFRIIPFRGEYYCLPAKHNRIVNHLIYPIPDPDLPFLGVHLTRMIDGSVTVGPNAVLGFKREGYGTINIDLRDTLDMIRYPGFWRTIGRHLDSGVAELRDSFYKPGYLRRVRKYCPQLTTADLLDYPAGIRAQAVKRDGSLVHDFLFAKSARSLHVCNAPSPAATSAMPIAEYLCREAAALFGL